MEKSTAKKKPNLKTQLKERMHDPLQLRFALCLGIMAAWYFGAYSPMMDQITKTTKKLDVDQKRLALATEVEVLRTNAAKFTDRLPPRSDPNEFLQFVLAGVRGGPNKMISLTPEKSKDAGPFQVASIKVEIEGKPKDIDTFLRWVETNKRLLRIDNLKIDPDAKDPEVLKAQVMVVGLMGVEAKPAAEKGKAEPAKAKPKAKAKTAKAPNSTAKARPDAGPAAPDRPT